MALVVNSNVQSLNSQRQLSSATNDLAGNFERLSSGKRINSAKDDAAGLQISSRLTSQINGLNQASRNANDGISLAQTAEGALGAMSDSLQRVRELSVQAANDTNSASDRLALNNEVTALLDEVKRVSLSTDFNGRRILDGTMGDSFFQVGANQGQMIAIDGVDARSEEIGASFTRAAAGIVNEDLDDIASFGEVTITALAGLTDTYDPIVTGATATGIAAVTSLEDAVRGINAEIDAIIAVGDANGENVAKAGLKAEVHVDDAGESSITITGNFDQGAFVVTGGDATLAATASVGAGAVAVTADVATATGLDDLDVITRAGAQDTLTAVNGALNDINSFRAEMGSVQSRFESTISGLSVASENLSAARSRIRDADFATETANLTRSQILQQAGTAMLSQANALPQSALSLLG